MTFRGPLSLGLLSLGAAVAFVAFSACATDPPSIRGDRDTEVEEPAGPSPAEGLRRGLVVPDITFEGLHATGAKASIRLRSFASEPSSPRVLLISVHGGAWCGTCVWAARHFDDGVPADARARVDRLDVVLRGRDNDLATVDRDARAWQGDYASGAPVVIDPGFVFVEALEGVAAPLPLVMVIDTTTMRIEDVLSNPDPSEVSNAVAELVAWQDGLDAPEPAEPERINGLFYSREWSMFQEMAAVPTAPPPDPTNEVADSAAAAALGEALFFDEGLSPSNTVACSTCHDPARAWTDSLAHASGVEEGARRTPSIVLSAHARWQSWDGRADSVWAQALAALENDREFASTRSFVARRVLSAHRALYDAAFPEKTPVDPAVLPATGKPGDPAFDRMTPAMQDATTEVFVDSGKAIAAYLRTLRPAPNRFDRYIAGDASALTGEEALGLALFARSGCTQCHWGPRLTNDAFHETGLGDHTRGRDADESGRLAGSIAYRDGEFRGDGRWSAWDAPVGSGDVPSVEGAGSLTRGQWKTPTLRGVGETSFFGHHGDFSDLGLVTEAYAFGDRNREPWIPQFTETAAWGIIPFLKTLTVSE